MRLAGLFSRLFLKLGSISWLLSGDGFYRGRGLFGHQEKIANPFRAVTSV